MKVATPRMGNLQLIVRDLAHRFGLDYVEPPAYSEKTMSIGASLAPEFACLPLKAVIGNFAQSLELGADTLLMGGGSGPCRFGYYAEIQKRILSRQGYRFDIVVLDPPSTSIREFFRSLRTVVPPSRSGPVNLVVGLKRSLEKLVEFDRIERWEMWSRCRQSTAGAVQEAAESARSMLSGAYSEREIDRARRDIGELFDSVPVEKEEGYLKVGLVGEIFVVLEPYFNFDAVEWLTRRGVMVERSVNMADTVTPGGRNPVFGYSEGQVARAARPYLGCEVGGDGLLSVGATALFARRGFDAVVHFLPFTCMPEVIAKSVLGRLSEDSGIPVLSLTIDEQTGRAGVKTRLEALLDLAWSKRRKERSCLEVAAEAR